LSPLKQPVLTDEVKFSLVSKTSNSENSPQTPYIKLSAHPVSKTGGQASHQKLYSVPLVALLLLDLLCQTERL